MTIEDAFIMQRARQLYWQGYPPAEIARLMGINPNTVLLPEKRDEWDTTPPIQRVTTSIDARLIQLTGKDKKTGGDFKEIDLLTRQLKSWITVRLRRSRRRRSAKAKLFQRRRSALRVNIIDSLHWHQKGWYENHHHRKLHDPEKPAGWGDVVFCPRGNRCARYPVTREIQASAQPDILSASRRQAYQFRSFICSAAEEVDVELKGGDMIQLFNGAELHFRYVCGDSAVLHRQPVF